VGEEEEEEEGGGVGEERHLAREVKRACGGMKRGRGKDEMGFVFICQVGGRDSSTAKYCYVFTHLLSLNRFTKGGPCGVGEARKGSNASLEDKGESTNSLGIDQQGPSAPGAASNDGDIHAALECWFGVLYAPRWNNEAVERKASRPMMHEGVAPCPSL